MSTIVQINTTQNIGSHGRIAEQLGLKVIAHGGESYFAYGRSMHESASKSIKIGCRCTLFGNIIVRDSSIIVASAVVNTNVVGDTITGGVPAKVIK